MTRALVSRSLLGAPPAHPAVTLGIAAAAGPAASLAAKRTVDASTGWLG